ncbi:hypothetical protein WG66_010054 [Moniliophthora roreri]|nr:hypothetical protein WG66_010054 [Moniliophthora roreri]
MTPEHEFLQASFKAVLVLLSGIAFRFSFTPPNNSGNSVSPPRPPLSEGFTALREWFMMAVLLDRAYPIERIFCLVAAINEALFILSTPIPSIRDVLPHLNVSTSINNTSLTPQFITSVLLSIAGGIFRVACYRALGNAFRYDCVPSESPTLVTHGPYSIVRHPSYVASWMAVIGSGLVHLIGGSWIIESGFLNTLIGKAMVYSWWGTFGTAIIGLTMRVGSEDELMKKQFGRKWERWSERSFHILPTCTQLFEARLEDASFLKKVLEIVKDLVNDANLTTSVRKRRIPHTSLWSLFSSIKAPLRVTAAIGQ